MIAMNSKDRQRNIQILITKIGYNTFNSNTEFTTAKYILF